MTVLVLENDFEFTLATFQLVTTVTHFVNDCHHVHFLLPFLLHRSSLEVRIRLFQLGLIISTLEIALANFLRNVLVLVDMADVHHATKRTFLTLSFCVPSFWHPFIPLPLSSLHQESTLLQFVLLGFPTHASLRDRSPESCEPCITFDSRSSLNKLTIRVHISFFPNSHLRVSCTHWIFWFTWRILTLRYAVPRGDSMCLLSPSEKVK